MTNYFYLISAEIGNVASNIVVAEFTSEPVTLDFTAGITIVVNGVKATILSVYQNRRKVQYKINQSVTSSDSIKLFYKALPAAGLDRSEKYGDYTASEFGVVMLETFSNITVINNISIANELRDVAVAYWTMNEVSGTRKDSKSINDLNILSGDTSVAGKVSNAIKMNDFDGYVRRATTNLNLYPNSWGIAFWVYFDAFNVDQVDKPVLGKYDDNSNNWEFAFYQNNPFEDPPSGRFSFSSFANSLSTSGASIVEDTWFFIVFEYDVELNKLRLYLDNVLDNEDDIIVGDINVLNGPFSIGANDGFSTGTHKMIIDELFIRTGVFTQAQRNFMWNSGAGTTLYP